jgi:hypothetical protein
MHRYVAPLVFVAAAAVLAGVLALSAGTAPVRAQQTESVELFRGCNNVSLTWSSGTATSVVAAGITPASALQSIWRFNNIAQTFQGFSAQFPSQSDLLTVNRIDAVFICMSGPGTLARPVLAPGGSSATTVPTTTATPAGLVQTRITFISAMAPRGSTVTVSIQTVPNTSCTGTATPPSGQTASLGQSTANASGVAVLYWQVPTNTGTGIATVRVTCGTTSDQAQVSIT